MLDEVERTKASHYSLSCNLGMGECRSCTNTPLLGAIICCGCLFSSTIRLNLQLLVLHVLNNALEYSGRFMLLIAYVGCLYALDGP